MTNTTKKLKKAIDSCYISNKQRKALFIALNRLDEYASGYTNDNIKEARQQQKDYNLLADFISSIK